MSHEIVWINVKTMTEPDVKYGYCKICGKSCKKIENEIIWLHDCEDCNNRRV